MGSGFLVFGGLGDSLYNDLNFYDFNSNNWVTLNPSGLLPGGRYESCMMMGNYLYITGGFTITGVTDEIWVYDFYSNTYYQAVNSGTIDLHIARHTCRLETSVDYETIYIYGGEGYFQFPNYIIYSIKLYITSGVFYYIISEVYFDETGMIGRSDSSLVYTSNYTFQFFGSIYGFYTSNYLTVTDSSTNQGFPIFLPYYFYSQSVLHYKKDFYIFGGGLSPDSTMQYQDVSSQFYKLTLDESDNVSMPCSLGGTGENCDLCGKGTYAVNLSHCEACPAGMVSTMRGGTSPLVCLPCDYRTFADSPGASYCKVCRSDQVCMIGTKTPLYNISVGQQQLVQPSAYQSPTSELSQNTVYFLIGGVVVVVFLVFLISEKVREYVKRIDLYASQHKQKELEPVVLKRTGIGGLFSAVFLVISILSLAAAFDAYRVSNVYESKGLVPLITISDNIFSQYFLLSATFYNYGGLCSNNSQCSTDIFLDDSTLSYLTRQVSCSNSIDACILSAVYTDIVIGFNPSVTITLQEQSSYASYISINVTSFSSIPGQISSVLIYAYPATPYEVFRGATPTVFSLQITPSVSNT